MRSTAEGSGAAEGTGAREAHLFHASGPALTVSRLVRVDADSAQRSGVPLLLVKVGRRSVPAHAARTGGGCCPTRTWLGSTRPRSYAGPKARLSVRFDGSQARAAPPRTAGAWRGGFRAPRAQPNRSHKTARAPRIPAARLGQARGSVSFPIRYRTNLRRRPARCWRGAKEGRSGRRRSPARGWMPNIKSCGSVRRMRRRASGWVTECKGFGWISPLGTSPSAAAAAA